MSFLHTTIKDAIVALKHDDRKKAQKIIKDHHKKFLGEHELASGREIQVLASLLDNWSDTLEMLSDEDPWLDMSSEGLLKKLMRIEEDITQIKEILKILVDEEKHVLE
jgi:hypothetical protein